MSAPLGFVGVTGDFLVRLYDHDGVTEVLQIREEHGSNAHAPPNTHLLRL